MHGSPPRPRPAPHAPDLRGARCPGLGGLIASLALFASACSSTGAGAERDPWPSEVVEGQNLYTLLPPGGIPAIDEPRFVSAQDAAGFLAPEEPVVGVVGANGTAKAYSAWHLEGHEVVNDVLDGEPIAVTW